MADKMDKVPENAPGKYYIDHNCVPCGDCMAEAPMLLQYTKDESKAFFHRQPNTPEEEEAARKAMDMCPSEAIGDDGDS